MSEETMPREKAVEDVRIMAERMAFLHYAFAKTLSEMLPAEEADLLTRMAIEEYGRLAAVSVTEHLEEQGKPVTPDEFPLRQGSALCGLGVYPHCHAGGQARRQDQQDNLLPPGCHLEKTAGRLPAGPILLLDRPDEVQALWRGYHCFHDKNAMDGDECCIIRCELGEPEEN